jgi:hypothetical protein
MAREPVWGIHLGIVEGTDDPEQRGRLRVRVPAVLGDTEIGWANACVPEPNRSAATFTPPEAGTLVWIQFEGGDITRPVWVGFALKR